MLGAELFVKGEIPKDYIGVAIVGSRKMTKRGEDLAYEFSYELAKNGIIIVSGLARGIDAVAHRAALDADGTTIAVMGSGLDIIYPSENKELAKEIIKKGALVSQFPYGTKPLPQNFKERNGLVVELSKALVVVEGQEKSGTINTANWAGDKGIEVFAIPGSPATDFLIENGANVAKSPKDILDYLICN